MPSPAAMSAFFPLSVSAKVLPPGVTVTGRPPAGAAQLIFSAESGWVPPVALGRGRSAPNTGVFEHVSDPYAFILRPVTVLPCMDVFTSPPARIRFLRARQSSEGLDASS